MLRNSLNQSVRPQTTAHLAQTMSLLELTSEELRQKVEADLAKNPALELADVIHCPYCHRPQATVGPCPICASRQTYQQSEPIIFVSPSRDFSFPKEYISEDAPVLEEWTAATEQLPAFVLRQIAPELEPEDRALAAHILTSLDEDGLLRIPLIEIALYHHVPLSRVEKVLHLIQRAEPVGVGSPSPKDAMLVQLETLKEIRPVPELVERIIRENMGLLSRHAYAEISNLLQISASEVEQLAGFIRGNLNPYPARTHWGEVRHSANSPGAYKQADILISQLKETVDSPLVVEIVSPYSGCLRVNPLFREAIQQAPVEKTEEWKEDIESANLLVKCLQQRDNTIVRLMQRLAVIQRKFILEGDSELIPMTRAQLAEELNLHESTISRAVANKAVQLPNKRIVPLRKLFDRSLNVRTALMNIITAENQPLSDAEIAKRLKNQGYEVARRTVAKYRSIEGILPARLRHSKNGHHKVKPHTAAKVEFVQ